MRHSLPLRLDQVSKSFGAVQALAPLSLDVKPGERMALLGPSGCGKTTTLRIVAGFSKPDTGSLHIGDRDVTELPPHKPGLGMVFQTALISLDNLASLLLQFDNQHAAA